MRLGQGLRCVGAGLLALMPAVVGLSPNASAQTPLEFYKSRSITMVIGGGVGGGYDVYFRIFARYLTRHIPGNPNIIAKNLPAASGLAAANAIYATSDKDGSVIGAFTNSVPLDPLFGNPGARFDARLLNWLGSIGKLQSVCSTWHTSPITSFRQAQEREVIVSSGGLNTNSAIIPRVLNALLDSKFEVVSGYDPGAGLTLSLERGEAEGICGLSWSTIKASRPQWIRDKLINVIVQIGLDKLPELPDVPAALDLLTDPDKKKVLELILIRQETGRPLAAPPGVPTDRLAVLRAAFDQTMKDPEFLAEAERNQLEIDPLSGAQIDKLLVNAYAAPGAIVQQAAELILPATARK